jgi:hypothetical protein
LYVKAGAVVVDMGPENSEVTDIVINVVRVALIRDIPIPGAAVVGGVEEDQARQLWTTASKAQSRRCIVLLLLPPLDTEQEWPFEVLLEQTDCCDKHTR